CAQEPAGRAEAPRATARCIGKAGHRYALSCRHGFTEGLAAKIDRRSIGAGTLGPWAVDVVFREEDVMCSNRMKLLARLLLTLSLVALGQPAGAQYTLIVGAPPGGMEDITGRLVARRLTDARVENAVGHRLLGMELLGAIKSEDRQPYLVLSGGAL